MFFGLALLAFGLAWMLNAVGLYSDQTFALVGSSLVLFAGILKLTHPKKSRGKGEDHF